MLSLVAVAAVILIVIIRRELLVEKMVCDWDFSHLRYPSFYFQPQSCEIDMLLVHFFSLYYYLNKLSMKFNQ
jgi:hypothetical protein